MRRKFVLRKKTLWIVMGEALAVQLVIFADNTDVVALNWMRRGFAGISTFRTLLFETINVYGRGVC